MVAFLHEVIQCIGMHWCLFVWKCSVFNSCNLGILLSKLLLPWSVTVHINCTCHSSQIGGNILMWYVCQVDAMRILLVIVLGYSLYLVCSVICCFLNNYGICECRSCSTWCVVKWWVNSSINYGNLLVRGHNNLGYMWWRFVHGWL